MIDEEILLSNGYNKLNIETEYDFIVKYSDAMYQKRVKDKKGTKYFITVYFYDGTFPSYEFELYSTLKDGIAINTKLYSVPANYKIQDVEKIIDDLFTNSNMNYYELD